MRIETWHIAGTKTAAAIKRYDDGSSHVRADDGSSLIMNERLTKAATDIFLAGMVDTGWSLKTSRES